MVTLVESTMPRSTEDELIGVVSNRRADTRYPAAEVPEITGLRVSPGEAATLVNISATGVLLESPQRFAPGQRVTVHFEGTLPTRQMKARIVRCQVSMIISKGVLQYQTAVTFDERLSLPNEPGVADAAPTPPAAATSSEQDDIAKPAPAVNRW